MVYLRHARTLLRIVPLVVVSLVLISCEDSEDKACPLTIDTVEIVDTKMFEGKNYTLVHRITGWHDKVEVLQLFDQEPELDDCRRDLVKPIIEDSLENGLVLVGFSINLENNSFELLYEDAEMVARADLRINFTSQP